jgi:hypothetical protein
MYCGAARNGAATSLWEDDELSEVEASALRAGAANELDVAAARAVARYEVAIFDV